MKKLLNTLFVTTQGAYLAKDGETVAVRIEQATALRVPVHTLASIVCFGNVGCSPFLLGMCGERGVTVSFLTENGRFLARVQGPVSGNVLLRREQYRRADDPAASAALATACVLGKIANCRTVLQRGLRDHNGKLDETAVQAAVDHLFAALRSLQQQPNLEQVRGIEGDAARIYFQALNHLILRDKNVFFMDGRNRRPPLDPVNCLLSFLYTLLRHDVSAALEGVGLDPAVGFLHRDRPGRPSLALDIMEEFRPIADRMALSLINLGQLQPRDFSQSGSGSITLSDAARKTVLTAYQKRKQEEMRHPFLEENMALGLFPHVQALLLARHLRGDLDGYPPLIWR